MDWQQPKQWMACGEAAPGGEQKTAEKARHTAIKAVAPHYVNECGTSTTERYG